MTNVTSVFDVLATSITNEMRRNDRVDGAVRQDETIALHGETSRWMTVYEMQ